MVNVMPVQTLTPVNNVSVGELIPVSITDEAHSEEDSLSVPSYSEVKRLIDSMYIWKDTLLCTCLWAINVKIKYYLSTLGHHVCMSVFFPC